MKDGKLIIQKVDNKNFAHKDSISEYKSWYVIHTDYGGYTENNIHISLSKNGYLSIWGDGEGNCLYSEQVELLRNILNKIDLEDDKQ